MIKASAGGGGKGMRIAHSRDEVAEGFARARSEAKSSFGDDRVFIEKFIVNPRHIEIQVLGDKHGNVIYLGERECSIQRRNQKVIEEAPSPLLDAATRKTMGEQAVALAKAVGYDSAGTVEFVAGQDRSFYFLEMNTRLQVEHPVTELVTGIDLVEQMIRVAAGEKLAIKQKDVEAQRLGGREPRLCRGPVPQLPAVDRAARRATGRRPKRSIDGVTVRNDTGVYEGGEISIYYDPMIAKLVTHAPTRAAAIDAQADALDAFVIDGIRHNIPFLAALMAHPRWRAGKLSTGFIAEEFPDGFQPQAPAGRDCAYARGGRRRDRSRAGRAQAADLRPDERPRGDARAPPRGAARRGTRSRSTCAREAAGIAVAFRRRRRSRRVRECWRRPGSRASRSGRHVDGGRSRSRCGRSPTASSLRIAASRRAAYVYTEREADAARLMPVKKAPTPARCCSARCRGWWSRSRSPKARRSRPARRSRWSRR